MAFSKEFQIGPAQVRSFADLVGDHNPVHLDGEFAATTRYKVPICHGMLVSSYLSGCLVEAFGQGTIYVEQQLRFRRPVPVGSRIRVDFGEAESLEKGQLKLPTTIWVQLGEMWKTCVEGYAVIVPGTVPAALA